VLAAPAALLLPRSAPVDAYAALLAEEHAAIHLYGLIGPRLPDSLRGAARAAYDDHRRHRDLLVALVDAGGGTPSPPLLAYPLPGSVATGAAARSAAITIEDSLALRWHAAVSAAGKRDRATLAGALGDEAEHLAVLHWSASHRAADAAVPFPGR
jgi:hypothetical protein